MALPISSIQLFQALREKLGEKEAQMLVDYVDNRNHDDIETHIQGLPKQESLDKLRGETITFTSAIKDDLQRFEEKMERRFEQIHSEFANADSKNAYVISQLADLRLEIAQTQIKTIRWMFAFWVGQLAVLAGLFIALAK